VKTIILIGAAAAALCGLAAAADTDAQIARELVALERQAMDGWAKGNPDPLLAISDPDITYFHVMTEKRLDGLAAVKALYEGFRGASLFDSYDLVDPKVQASGDVAVLTYVFVRRIGEATSRWNATQVYQKKKDGWRVIHSHWSQIRTP
jgi:ketosteroid isomerase-like protein